MRIPRLFATGKHRKRSRLRPWLSRFPRLFGASVAALGLAGIAAGSFGVLDASASPTVICGTSILNGPLTAPVGSVILAPGPLSGDNSPNTIYYFPSGTYTLSSGEYDQIDPGAGDSYIGAPGAVITGGGVSQGAFEGTASGVTIQYLTIEDFATPNSQGAVNHDSGAGWVIEDDTITGTTTGAGVMVGSDDTITDDCLSNNGEYGLSAYVNPKSPTADPLTGGPSSIVITNNEIINNGTAAETSGCGCSGGGKFWRVDGAKIEGNNVLDNGGGAGLWADTDNVGFDVDGNWFTGNTGVGWQEETSYNYALTNDVFTDNAWGLGPSNPGFPEGAIYVSESGGDPRIAGPESGEALISNDTFVNNWSGVVLWESADRFCGSPNNTSSGICTLVAPSVANINTCTQSGLSGATASNPLYWDCRWRTQDTTVTDNSFSFTQSAIPNCSISNSCGENAIFSQYGTSPSWSPYKGTVIETSITTAQNNLFSDNTYSGPWSYMWGDQSSVLTFPEWQAEGQDVNGTSSTTTTTAPATTTTTTTTLPPTTTTTTTTLPPTTTTTTTTTTLPTYTVTCVGSYSPPAKAPSSFACTTTG